MTRDLWPGGRRPRERLRADLSIESLERIRIDLGYDEEWLAPEKLHAIACDLLAALDASRAQAKALAEALLWYADGRREGRVAREALAAYRKGQAE